LKNKKALYLLLIANAISQFAQGISMLAIPWYFASRLNATSTFSLIYAGATFISIFWGLYAGTLIDRFPRKNIFLGICMSSAVAMFSISSIGLITGDIPMFWIAFAFCFTLLNFNIHYPTLYAFGQEITERHQYRKTNSLLEVMGQAINVLSGGMAVLLIEGINTNIAGFSIDIEPWSIQKIFFMDGASYLLAMIIIAFIKYTPTVEKKISKAPILDRLKEGFTYLKQNPLIFYFGNFSYTVFIFVLIANHVLWPTYIDQHLGASGDTYATTRIFYAIGALFAGFFISKIFRQKSTIYSIISLMTIALISFLVLAITQDVQLLLIFSLGLGVANAGIRIQRITYMFNHIPNHVIGRTNSVFQSINVFLRAIFLLLFSLTFFSVGSNIIWTFAIAAAAILVSLFPLIIHYKSLKELKSEMD